MARANFRCPHCGDRYRITTFHLGYSQVVDMRCNRCSATVLVDIYSRHASRLHRENGGNYTPGYFRALTECLAPCACGGRFVYDAPFRCRRCNAEVSLAEIKRQINWWGSPDGRPGILMKRESACRWKGRAKNEAQPTS